MDEPNASKVSSLSPPPSWRKRKEVTEHEDEPPKKGRKARPNEQEARVHPEEEKRFQQDMPTTWIERHPLQEYIGESTLPEAKNMMVLFARLEASRTLDDAVSYLTAEDQGLLHRVLISVGPKVSGEIAASLMDPQYRRSVTEPHGHLSVEPEALNHLKIIFASQNREGEETREVAVREFIRRKCNSYVLGATGDTTIKNCLNLAAQKWPQNYCETDSQAQTPTVN